MRQQAWAVRQPRRPPCRRRRQTAHLPSWRRRRALKVGQGLHWASTSHRTVHRRRRRRRRRTAHPSSQQEPLRHPAHRKQAAAPRRRCRQIGHRRHLGLRPILRRRWPQRRDRLRCRCRCPHRAESLAFAQHGLVGAAAALLVDGRRKTAAFVIALVTEQPSGTYLHGDGGGGRWQAAPSSRTGCRDLLPTPPPPPREQRRLGLLGAASTGAAGAPPRAPRYLRRRQQVARAWRGSTLLVVRAHAEKRA